MLTSYSVVTKPAVQVQDFWTHGAIDSSQIESARVRVRGSRKTKTNTDYEIRVAVEDVVYKAAVKGEGDPNIRCPEDGRVWVTQPCVVCNKDDGEESLLLCGDNSLPLCAYRSQQCRCSDSAVLVQ